MREAGKGFTPEQNALFERLSPYLDYKTLAGLFNSTEDYVFKKRKLMGIKRNKNKMPMLIMLPADSWEEFQRTATSMGFNLKVNDN